MYSLFQEDASRELSGLSDVKTLWFCCKFTHLGKALQRYNQNGHFSFAWSQKSTCSHQYSSGHQSYLQHVWDKCVNFDIFPKMTDSGIFSGSLCCLFLPVYVCVLKVNWIFLKWCNPQGHCASVTTFLGTLREINLEPVHTGFKEKGFKEKKKKKNLGICEEIGWGIFFFFPLPKVWGYINGKYCHCQETNPSWGAIGSWQNLSTGAGLPGVQAPSRQGFCSQCFCQPSWTSELLLFNYGWILATLRQWAFTIAREVIAFTFKAWPNHKSRITDISWKEASFKSL